MASLRVIDSDGKPVSGADVHVEIPGRDFNRTYVTNSDGLATIGISPYYAGSSAHVIVKATIGLVTKYAAFDWAVGLLGLDPPTMEVTLQREKPDATIDWDKWTLRGLAAALIIAVAIGGVSFIRR